MPLSENPEVHPLLGEKVACATVSTRWSLLSYKCSRYYLPLWQLHTDFVDFSHEVYHVMKTAVISSHLFLNREGRWGTTNDFGTSFFQLSLFSTALLDLSISRPAYSLMLSSHLSLCLPCLLLPFTVPCKMVLARPDERET